MKCEKWKYNRAFKEFVFDRIVYYTGFTDDPKRRLHEHRNGIRSAWMMRNNVKPLSISYLEVFDNSKLAKIRKKQIKQMSRNQKLNLIENYLKL